MQIPSFSLPNTVFPIHQQRKYASASAHICPLNSSVLLTVISFCQNRIKPRREPRN